MDWEEAKARLVALRPLLTELGMAPASDALGAALQRVAELEAIVARERQERDAAEAEFSRLLAGKLAAEARVEELEREKESREAWWKRRIAEHQQAERDYLAEVRRLEGLIADIAEDAVGDDAPINRGLNSVQACIREREARHA